MMIMVKNLHIVRAVIIHARIVLVGDKISAPHVVNQMIVVQLAIESPIWAYVHVHLELLTQMDCVFKNVF